VSAILRWDAATSIAADETQNCSAHRFNSAPSDRPSTTPKHYCRYQHKELGFPNMMSTKCARTSAVTSIARTVPAHHRPFAAAVSARPESSGACRAAATWRRFIIDLLGPVTARWPEGMSIDVLDGDVSVVSHVGATHVDVHIEATPTNLDPMHIRSVLQVIDHVRPSMRREAPISVHQLDSITSQLVAEVIARYPVAAHPSHRPVLERLQRRLGGVFVSPNWAA